MNIANNIMKTTAICSFFILFAIAAVMISSTPAAFADHPAEVTIIPDTGSGSGTDDCIDIEYGCYVPGIATVAVNGKVIFSNTDSAAHTFSSGGPGSDDVGIVFDTGMVIAGNSYEWTPDTVGEYPYFCMIHPWMQSMIIVQEAHAEEVMEEVVEETAEEEVMEEVVEETAEEEVMEEVVDVNQLKYN